MILIADDDRSIRSSLGMMLKRAGFDTVAVSTPAETVARVRESEPDLILMDMNFGGSTTGADGIELLRRVKVLCPEVPVILMTAWGSIPLAVEGMKYGAFDFITKPWDTRALLQTVNSALSLSTRREEKNECRETPEFDRCGIIGESAGLTGVLDMVRRIAPTDASVLITGENGTGKELIAQAIHANSPRRAKPFVMVNLGGLAQSLFESEMFGHAKGAFTGAVCARPGRFKTADGGTIFLDEIGDLDLSCQVKMLRVLQQRQFEPLGQSKPEKVDVRVVCATNADLPAMLREHTFREDLYYRINTITVHLPALRERREDIPLLVRHFIGTSGGAGKEFSTDAMQLLTRLPYPGNIRQLKNIVERAMLISAGPVVTPSDIDVSAQDMPESQAPVAGGTLEERERAAVVQALETHKGNLSGAAAELGITRQSLYRRMEKFGIKI